MTAQWCTGALGLPGDEPGSPPEAFCSDRQEVDDLSVGRMEWLSPTTDNRRFVPASLAELPLSRFRSLLKRACRETPSPPERYSDRNSDFRRVAPVA